MAMDINSVYGNYAGVYTNSKETKQVTDLKTTNEGNKTEKQGSAVGNTQQNESVRKTATDELAYLSQKFDGFTFVATNFRQGMRYGSLSTTNIAISPDFLKKMANNPELEKEYTDQFENMKRLDEQNIKSHEAQGRHLIAQGWAIDKDGGMSKWGISEADNKRHYGQEMTDYANKVRKEKAEKRKEQEKIATKKEAAAEKKEALEEKRKSNQEEQAALKEKIDVDNRELLGDKYKRFEWYDASDDIFSGEATKVLMDGAVGLNLDIKL